MQVSRPAALARLGAGLALALAAGSAVALRNGPADGFLAFSVVAALLAGLVVVAALEPAVTICAGLALSIFSGQFSHLGSPVGIDRVVVLAGIGAVVVRELRSPMPTLRIRRVHLALAVVLAYAVASAMWAGTLRSNGPFFSLVDNLGVIPFALFFVAPAAFPTERERRILLVTLVGVGLYLGATAFLEIVGPKGLVFPRYIMDPYVGIHYGRARGPFVEAAADGLAIYICGVGCAIALARWRNKILPSVGLVLCAAGIVFTLTRQVWVAGAVATVLAMVARRELRPLLIPAAVVTAAGVLALLAFVPGFESKAHNRADSQLPVWDRLNSNAATERMIEARPILGFGWATFAEKGLPFYRLASDRPLTTVPRPHNVLLANGAELGVPATLVWLASLGVAVFVGARRRGPPDLDIWRTGLVAVAAAWFVVANFTPMNYAFCHAALWLWAGLCWSRT